MDKTIKNEHLYKSCKGSLLGQKPKFNLDGYLLESHIKQNAKKKKNKTLHEANTNKK